MKLVCNIGTNWESGQAKCASSLHPLRPPRGVPGIGQSTRTEPRTPLAFGPWLQTCLPPTYLCPLAPVLSGLHVLCDLAGGFVRCGRRTKLLSFLFSVHPRVGAFGAESAVGNLCEPCATSLGSELVISRIRSSEVGRHSWLSPEMFGTHHRLPDRLDT